MGQVTIKPIAGALGAEISGIDLRELNAETTALISDALIKHQVIFFRDQPLEPEHLIAVGRLFGPLKAHPAYAHAEYPDVAVLDHSEAKPSKIELWHTDMTFLEKPPLGSVLHGLITPKGSGDTLWASMYSAWEGLSSAMKDYLEGMSAVHDFSWGFRESLSEPGGRERLGQAVIDNPPVVHPVVRTHPVTRRKALFVNRLFTTRLVGVPAREGDAILQFLFDHGCAPEFTCRFQWEPHSVAFWDNRCTQHRPVNDHGLKRRLLQRVTVEGERPV